MMIGLSCVSLGAGPVARDAGGLSDADVDLARGVVKAYVGSIEGGDSVDRAVKLFHCPDPQQQLRAMGVATLDSTRRVCRDAVALRIGRDAAKELFPDLTYPMELDKAIVTPIEADKGAPVMAIVRTRGGLALQLIKVGDRWLIWVPPPGGARSLVAPWTRGGRTALTEAHARVASEVMEGRHKTVEEARRAILARVEASTGLVFEYAPPASETPTTRPIKSDPANAADPDSPREVLRAYLKAIELQEEAAAVGLCHASTEEERLLADAMARLGISDVVWRREIHFRLGGEVVKEVGGNSTSSEGLDDASVQISRAGDGAVVQFNDARRFHLKKVDGRWLLSFATTLREEGLTPGQAIAEYAAMGKRYLEVADEVRRGKLTNAAQIKSAMSSGGPPPPQRAK
jgi:hypothetical protein